MAGAFNDPERTQSASATSATHAAEKGTPPAGEQVVGYALWLKQWFERNNTVEERLARLLFMKLEPEELGFVLYLSACITFATAFTLVAVWASDFVWAAEPETLTWPSWSTTTGCAKDWLRTGAGFLFDTLVLPQVPAVLALSLIPLVVWTIYCLVVIPGVLLCTTYSFGCLALPMPFTNPRPLRRVLDATFVPFVVWCFLSLVKTLAPLSPYVKTLLLALAVTAYFDVHPLARLFDLVVELEQDYRNGRLGKCTALQQPMQNVAGDKLRHLEEEVALLKERLAARTPKRRKSSTGAAR